MQWTDESIAFLRDAAAMNRYYETIAERIAPQLPDRLLYTTDAADE